MGAPDLQQRLVRDAASLGVALAAPDAQRLLALLDELQRWNRTYNLTAITDREQMFTHHLLDSLSVQRSLQGARIADVGTGAGFPGLPLALVNPQRHFTLIDSNNKKIRFVAHAARLLGLANVDALHVRAEAFTPPAPFDTVVARAFAALPSLLEAVAPLCGPDTLVLAMKGRRPDGELDALPPGWQLGSIVPLDVPGLGEERHLVEVRRDRTSTHSPSAGLR
jgi:16S rRNA (guanine527-N7)-methyltransferase